MHPFLTPPNMSMCFSVAKLQASAINDDYFMFNIDWEEPVNNAVRNRIWYICLPFYTASTHLHTSYLLLGMRCYQLLTYRY